MGRRGAGWGLCVRNVDEIVFIGRYCSIVDPASVHYSVVETVIDLLWFNLCADTWGGGGGGVYS